MPETRAEHLAWAKARALEYVDDGRFALAFASLASDLNKHPELSNHPSLFMGAKAQLGGLIRTADEWRGFIEGIN